MNENAATDENAATERVNEESQEGDNDKDSQSENDKSQELEVDEDNGKVSAEEKQALIVEMLKIVEVETFDSHLFVEDDKVEYLVRLRGLTQHNKHVDEMVSSCESVKLDADFVQRFVHTRSNNSEPGTPVAAPRTSKNCSPSTVGSSEVMDKLCFIPNLACRWIKIIEGLAKPPDAKALAKSSLGSEFAVMHWEENKERPLGPLVWRPQIIKRVRKN
jgi:hypothetical protein